MGARAAGPRGRIGRHTTFCLLFCLPATLKKSTCLSYSKGLKCTHVLYIYIYKKKVKEKKVSSPKKCDYGGSRLMRLTRVHVELKCRVTVSPGEPSFSPEKLTFASSFLNAHAHSSLVHSLLCIQMASEHPSFWATASPRKPFAH